MNVYDFDETIYRGDSSVDFYKHCLKKYPKIARLLPRQFAAYFRYKSGKITKTQMKEVFFAYMKMLPNTLGEAQLFWETHKKNIKAWYIEQKRDDDVIISASPYFLLHFVCDNLIASNVDPASGVYTRGINCHDSEKVRRFYEIYPNGKIDEFYSDSLVDAPLAKISAKAFLVKGDKLKEWPL